MQGETNTKIVYSSIHVEELCIIIRFQTRKLDSRFSACFLNKEGKAVSTLRKVGVAQNGEGMRQGEKRTKHTKSNS